MCIFQRPRASPARCPGPGSTPACSPSTTMRAGKKTRRHSNNCTVCANASRRWSRPSRQHERKNDPMMDIHAIVKQLPHRYPFLLVDKVIELERNTRIKAIKNVTYNEPYFMGHFPGRPVMPGVLILEALAQAAGLLAFDSMGKVPDENTLYYLVGIDGARFKRPVEPGDQLILAITIDRVRGGIWKFKGLASVGDEVACEAELMCTMRSVGEPDRS